MIGLIIPWLPVFAWEVVDEWHLLREFRRDYLKTVRRGNRPDLLALAKLLQRWLNRGDFQKEVLCRILKIDQNDLAAFIGRAVEGNPEGDIKPYLLYLKAHLLVYRLEPLNCTDPLCQQTEWSVALHETRELLAFIRTYQGEQIMNALGDLISDINDRSLFCGEGIPLFVQKMRALETVVREFLSSVDTRTNDR